MLADNLSLIQLTNEKKKPIKFVLYFIYINLIATCPCILKQIDLSHFKWHIFLTFFFLLMHFRYHAIIFLQYLKKTLSQKMQKVFSNIFIIIIFFTLINKISRWKFMFITFFFFKNIFPLQNNQAPCKYTKKKNRLMGFFLLLQSTKKG